MVFEDTLMPSTLAYSFYPAAVRAVSPVHVSVHNGLQRASSPPTVTSITAQWSRRTSRLAHLLLQLVRTPRILAHLLAHLDWADVHPLLCTCKALHDDLFASIPHLDVLLSRFVPGYAYSLRQRDFGLYQDVPITLHDLDLLLISLKTPLGRYPSHGLHILNALYPTYEDDAATLKLIGLTQAHTRFVLLLQSIVHSSPLPIPPDLPGGADDYANLISSPVSPRIPSRELVFPAPLAFPTAITTQANSQLPKLTSTRRSRNYKNDQLTNDSLSSFTFPCRTPKRRLSLLANNPVPVRPPPPPEEPRAMKLYSDTWRRRSSIVRSSGPSTSHVQSFSPNQSRSSIDNFNSAHRIRSSDSISSSFYTPSPPFARNSFHTPSPPPPPSPFDPTPQTVHALRSALSRTRAPILRVFVPTHSLTSAALEACERQLQDSGTWEHMSVGDVVCNFGYVPGPEPEPEPGPATTTGVNRLPIGGRQLIGEFGGYSGSSSSGSDDDILMRRNQERRRWSSSSVLPTSLYPSPMSPHQQQYSSWLLFDGEILIPYTPPDLLHIPNPLSLPSPFYYNHFLAQHLNLSPNPRFVLDRLPVFSAVTPSILPQQHPVVAGNGNGYTPHHHHSQSYAYGQGNGNGYGIAHTSAPTPRHPPPPPPKAPSKVPPTVPPKQIARKRSNPYVNHNHVPTQQGQQSRRHSMSPLPPTPSPSPSFTQPQWRFSYPYATPSPSVPKPMQTSQMPTQITLTQTTSKVPSPQSPTGYVSVKRFVWTAAVQVLASQQPQLPGLALPPPLLSPASQNQSEKVIGGNNSRTATPGPLGTAGTGTATTSKYSIPHLTAATATPIVPAQHPNTEQALGSAWHGTWIFEVEGTKEGRELLLSLLAGRMPALPPPLPMLGDSVAFNDGDNPGGAGKMLIAQGRAGLLCEVVRDRSGGGVVWIRVLPM